MNAFQCEGFIDKKTNFLYFEFQNFFFLILKHFLKDDFGKSWISSTNLCVSVCF